MQKKAKRLVALLLSLLMVISMIPVNGLTVAEAANTALAEKSVSTVIGGTSRIKIRNAPIGAKITYKSAQKSIATVSNWGEVKGIQSGTTNITVFVEKNSKTTKMTYKINVKKPELSQSKLSLRTGNTSELSVKNKPKQATYSWSSDDPRVATIDENGKVTAKAAGKTTIKGKVKTAQTTYSLSCEVTVTASGGGSTGGSASGGSGGGAGGSTGGNTGGSTGGGSSTVKPATYTVTFYLIGGIVSKHSSAKVTAGDKATAPKISNPGYTLDGWYTDQGMSAKAKYDFSKAVDQDLKLYAQWKPNTGTDADNAADHESTEVAPDDEYTLSADKKEVVVSSPTAVKFFVNSTLTTDHFELYCDGKPTGVSLYDDGNYNSHHDDLNNDGCYTGMYTIDIATEGDVEFKAKANIGSKTIETKPWSVFVYKKITDAETNYMLEINKEITKIITDTKSGMDKDAGDEEIIKAIKKEVAAYLQELKDHKKIDEVDYDPDSHAFTWIYCDTGLDAIRFIWDDGIWDEVNPDSKAGSSGDTEDESHSRPPILDDSTKVPSLQMDISSGSAVILNYYDKNHAWSKNYDAIGEELDDAGFSVEYKYDFECKDFMELQKYNSLILLNSHGNTLNNKPDGTPMICTQEEWNNAKDKVYSSDIKKKRILQVALTNGSCVYWISPKLFEFYYAEKPLSKPIVNLGCCRNFPDNNDAMVKAIEGAGASAVCGYSATVSVSYDLAMTNALVDRLLDGDTVGVALEFAKQPPKDKDSAYDSAWQTYAALKLHGNPEATLYHQLSNGAFEWDDFLGLDSLTSWKTAGDARSIYKLAGIQPNSRPKMAIISSGFGSMNGQTISSIYQTFLVPEGATTLSFSYDVVSEEPMEWWHKGYDDKFVAEILDTKGKVCEQLVEESVDKSKWYPVAGINFPDGDDTTYHTRWQDYSSDVLAKYQGQLIVIRFTVYDCGDAIYDTAALIDSITVGSGSGDR